MARVGLLEDNTRIARLCVTMLNFAGHDVVSYVDAHECLQSLAILNFLPLPPTLARAQVDLHPLPIDVLVLDLHLPSMSGLEVLQYLRNHPRTSALPLIFCTAAPIPEINSAR